MTFEILRKQPIKFYEYKGLKFFEPFRAVDNAKKPLDLFWNHKPESSTIVAKSTYNDNISLYDIEANRLSNRYRGLAIVANPKRKGIGEVLNLASIINFKENNFSDYSVFALRDSIQFYTKYGFNLLSSNVNEVVHNLKFLTKDKSERFDDLKDSARFFMKKIEKGEKGEYFVQGNNLVSDYIRTLARNGQKIDGDDLYSHTHMHFSTIDTIRNKDYLNELLDKHEIDYKI